CTALTTPTVVGATGAGVIGGTTFANNITNACLGNAAFFNPSQDLAPNFVARWRIEQPWGHIQAGVQTILYTLNDGMFLNKQYLGYGGSLGNFFTWGGRRRRSRRRRREQHRRGDEFRRRARRSGRQRHRQPVVLHHESAAVRFARPGNDDRLLQRAHR